MLLLPGDRTSRKHTTLIYNKGKEDNQGEGNLISYCYIQLLIDFNFPMPNKMAVIGR